MEPIIVHLNPQTPSSASGQGAASHAPSAVGTVGSKVLSMQIRRTYALAPCHHMFHTACLAQWLAVKVSRMCIRSLQMLTSSIDRMYALFVNGHCHLCEVSTRQTLLACIGRRSGSHVCTTRRVR